MRKGEKLITYFEKEQKEKHRDDKTQSFYLLERLQEITDEELDQIFDN